MQSKAFSFFNTEENQRWPKIRGWLLPSAAEKLYKQAGEVSIEGAFVEVGSFAGKSTVCIARALQEKNNTSGLFCVDISFQPEFSTNVEQFGVSDLVHTISASSLAAADTWNQPISFLYIDGHHGKAHAYADFVVWDTLLQPGAIVALDDTAGFFLGPSLQIQAAIRTGAYELIDDVGGVSFLRKKRPLIPAIGDFPLSEGSLMALVVNASAWSGAMDTELRLPPLPKVHQNLDEFQLRVKALDRPRLPLEQLEALPGLDQRTTYTLLYLRGCIDMSCDRIDNAIQIFQQLESLDFSCPLIHYKIDVRQIAGLRLAQAYDLQGNRELAKSTYQQILYRDIIPEIEAQAKLGLSEAFQLAAIKGGWLLREYVIESPLAKYRSYFQSSQDSEATLSQQEQSQLQSSPEVVIEKLSKLQGMTSPRERLYLYEYMRKDYSGTGEIVELGCWLGSATICMAMGLESNLNVTAKSQRIHVYDQFTWMPGWNQLPDVVGTSIEGKYKPGDSFVDEYMKRTDPWRNMIQVYPGDLTKMGWNHQGDIEFLFVDAMKSWPLINSIIKNFFRYLVPDLSIVHHNDWAHVGQPGIHLTMYKLRDYFIPIYDAAPAMVFKNIKRIPDDLLNKIYNYKSFSNREIEQAFDYAFSISPESMHPLLFGAKGLSWVRRGDLEIAKLEIELAKLKYAEIAKPGSAFANQFEWVEKLMADSQKVSK
jgi:predicted O-methyltransferase YrrM